MAGDRPASGAMSDATALRPRDVSRTGRDSRLRSVEDAGSGLDSVLKIACDAFGACGAAISHRQLGGWVTTHLCGLALSSVGAFHTDEECPAMVRAERSLRPVYIPNIRKAVNVNLAHADQVGYTAYAAIPMGLGNRFTGVLTLFFDERHSELSDADLDSISGLGLTVTLAEQAARMLGNERDTAEALQRTLVEIPGTLPGLDLGAAYHPAAEAAQIGGDFYDAFPVADGRVAIVIGDVSPKGIDAAATAAMVRDAIRTAALDGVVPGRVLTKANQVLRTFSSPEVFATAVFGVQDIASGEFQWANAGHPPPLVYDSTSRVRTLDHHGPLMGVLEDASFDTEGAVVPAGGGIVLYTDGLIEARRRNTEFGVEGIALAVSSAGCLSAAELASAVYEAARDYAGGSLQDDAAVMTVARRAE